MAASATADAPALRSAIVAAGRRQLLVLVLSELPGALSLILAATLVLLLAGTVLFHPGWLLAAGILTFGGGAFRVHKRRDDRYRLAQLLDKRLHLNDSLSTSWFLLEGGDEASRTLTPHRNWQLAATERLATTLDPVRAFPIPGSRQWLVPLLMAFAVVGLLAFRFGQTSTLDLHARLIPFALPDFFSPAASAEERVPDRRNPVRKSPGPRAELERPDLTGEASPQGQPLQAKNSASPNSASMGNAAASATDSLQQQLGGPPQANAKDASTLQKMSDALSGLASKLENAAKPSQPPAAKQGAKSRAQAQEGGQPGPPQNRAEGQKETQRGGQQEQAQSEKSSSASEAKAVEKASTQQSGNGAEPSRDAGASAQSGAGRNDGRKDVLDAQQLRALGKLSEILGKRSAAVSGDMTIEKNSSKQQLATEYSNRVGVHTDRGATLHHDEVPEVYRDYVKAYLDAVRKDLAAQP